jgi:protein tyrosine phosphatase
VRFHGNSVTWKILNNTFSLCSFQTVPKSGEGFIDFIGQVHKTKEQFGQQGPIAIHCSAGVGRTGVFVTLSILLERMQYEGVIDVFQTVRILRSQRIHMVQTEVRKIEHFSYFDFNNFPKFSFSRTNINSVIELHWSI